MARDLTGITRGGGASANRFHAPKDGSPVGPELLRVLRAAAVKRNIDVRTNSRVTRINTNGGGAITGVDVLERHNARYRIEARAVVVAAGGFSANKEMVAKYCPKCTGMATSNQPGATGEGMLLAEQAGAELIDMDQVQIHPSLGANTNILVTEASRGAGAIMVNREGKRFVDELTTRDLASAAILAQTGKTAFLVFDGGIRKRLKTFEGLFHLGLGKESPTLEGLAKILGVDPATLATSIATYNKYQQSKNDEEFKRSSMALPLTEAPFCSIEIEPGVHYTMGGISINGLAQALRKGGAAGAGPLRGRRGDGRRAWSKPPGRQLNSGNGRVRAHRGSLGCAIHQIGLAPTLHSRRCGDRSGAQHEARTESVGPSPISSHLRCEWRRACGQRSACERIARRYRDER